MTYLPLPQPVYGLCRSDHTAAAGRAKIYADIVCVHHSSEFDSRPGSIQTMFSCDLNSGLVTEITVTGPSSGKTEAASKVEPYNKLTLVLLAAHDF